MSATRTIAPGRVVSLHLEIRLNDGFVALSTFDAEPIHCTIGDGTLAPGLEETLAGMAAGQEETILAHGSELFGAQDPDKIHWLDRADFPPDLEPAPGQVLAFATPGGHETSGIVLELEQERARVDLNHPFSGRPLMLRIRVLEVD